MNGSPEGEFRYLKTETEKKKKKINGYGTDFLSYF